MNSDFESVELSRSASDLPWACGPQAVAIVPFDGRRRQVPLGLPSQRQQRTDFRPPLRRRGSNSSVTGPRPRGAFPLLPFLGRSRLLHLFGRESRQHLRSTRPPTSVALAPQVADRPDACDRGRAWPSSPRTQGADLGGAKGKPEDAGMRSVPGGSSGHARPVGPQPPTSQAPSRLTSLGRAARPLTDLHHGGARPLSSRSPAPRQPTPLGSASALRTPPHPVPAARTTLAGGRVLHHPTVFLPPVFASRSAGRAAPTPADQGGLSGGSAAVNPLASLGVAGAPRLIAEVTAVQPEGAPALERCSAVDPPFPVSNARAIAQSALKGPSRLFGQHPASTHHITNTNKERN